MVYPLSCGETALKLVRHYAVLGLSPRLRGNLTNTAALYGQTGSIPAPAGKPSHFGADNRLNEVYPRACGETGYESLKAYPGMGLSPRLWGNRQGKRQPRTAGRSIPAPAGKP